MPYQSLPKVFLSGRMASELARHQPKASTRPGEGTKHMGIGCGPSTDESVYAETRPMRGQYMGSLKLGSPSASRVNWSVEGKILRPLGPVLFR